MLASRLRDTYFSSGVAHWTRCPPAPGGASAESPETGRGGRLNTCFQRPGGCLRTVLEEGLGAPRRARENSTLGVCSDI